MRREKLTQSTITKHEEHFTSHDDFFSVPNLSAGGLTPRVSIKNADDVTSAANYGDDAAAAGKATSVEATAGPG